MAAVGRSSFVLGSSLLESSPALQPRIRRSHLRIVCQSSATMRGSEGDVLNQGGEIASILNNGIDKRRSLWWAPLFNVSTEDQWSDLLAKSENVEKTDDQMQTASSSTSTGLPGLISSSNGRRAERKAGQVEFTPEKARALRKSMRDSETWHDGWYHSAIASRLAEE